MKFVLIGFGGTGSEIVNNVYGRIPASMQNDFAAYAIDTDQDDLRNLENIIPTNRIVTSRDETVGSILNKFQGKNFSFLSKHRSVLNTPIAEGAGQVRQVSRFGFETMEEDLGTLTAGIDHMLLQAQRNDQGIQIYFIGSICGGTGSGCMLQIANFISNYISSVNDGVRIYTTACLLLPGVYTEMKDVELDANQKNRLKANAYAFIKEWNTYNAIFHEDYKGDKKNFNLLHLNLGQKGGITYSISKQDLLNINQTFQEPFNSFLCIDNTSANGGALKSLQDYKDMLEDFLFFYTTTGVAGTASSRLVNSLPALMTPGAGGISRFNGLGVSKIIYPKNQMEELASLKIFKTSFSENYLRIDKEYLKEKAKIDERKKFGDFSQEDFTRGQFFVKQFKEWASSDLGIFDGFYKICDSELKYAKRDEGQTTVEYVYKHDICFERIQEFISSRVEKIRTTSDIPAIDHFQKSIDRFIETFSNKEDKIGEVIKLEKQINEFEYQIGQISDSTVKNIAANIVSFLDVSQGILKGARNSNYNILHYMLGSTESEETMGVMNPVSIRFFLYNLTELIKDRYDSLYKRVLGSGGEYSGEIQSILENLEEVRELDYLSSTDEIENPVEAIRRAEEKNRNWGGAFKFINDQTKDFWRIYKPAIENESSELINLFVKKIEHRVLGIVLNQLNMMTSLWETYFTNVEDLFNKENNFVDQSINRLTLDNPKEHYQEIFYDRNPEKSKKYKLEFIEEVSKSSNMDGVLGDRITETLALESLWVLKEVNDKDRALDLESITLGAKDIISSLKLTIQEMQIFNMSLIEAWRKHLSLRNSEELESDINQLMAETLDRIKRISGPYMIAGQNNPVTNTYTFWGIHKMNQEEIQNLNDRELSRKLGVKLRDDTVDQILSKDKDGEGFISDNPVITPYEIICNTINTGFSFQNVFDFLGPQNPKIDDIFRHPMNAGNYYKSYFGEKLNNWLRGEASVHIDERWSGLHILKELNDDLDEMFEEEVKKAFIRGLTMNWLNSVKNDDRDNTWRVDCNWFEDSMNRSGFLYMGDEPLEARFYDLYKGLYNNMFVVLKINGYQDTVMEYEGAFEKQFDADRKGSARYSWRYHKFVLGCSSPINYELYPKTKYNILDVICSLHQEGPNNNETFKLQEDLIHILMKELISYHQKVYGKADNHQRRLRNVINDILRTSKIANNQASVGDCKLRDKWFGILLEYYKVESTLKEKFKLCKQK